MGGSRAIGGAYSRGSGSTSGSVAPALELEAAFGSTHFSSSERFSKRIRKGGFEAEFEEKTKAARNEVWRAASTNRGRDPEQDAQ